MVRGLYTSQSGMESRLRQMDIISNNLANLSTSGYKKGDVVFKSFPEMLLRSVSGKGIVQVPNGSYDLAPFIGKLGTGVAINQGYTHFDQGNIRATSNQFDFSIIGNGFFAIKTPRGERYTRDGSFLLDKDSYLVTKDGYRVQGENGDIQIKASNFKVSENGEIRVNLKYDSSNLADFVTQDENQWESESVLDHIKVVDFYDHFALIKEGDNLYVATKYSGRPESRESMLSIGKVKQGFLEMSNVNPVLEMTRMIEVQRVYEAGQKALSIHDQLSEKIIDQVLKV